MIGFSGSAGTLLLVTKEGATEQEFRQEYLQNFTKNKALNYMFVSAKQRSEEYAVPQGGEWDRGNQE